MKFWLLHSVFMLAAVAYAASVAPIQATHSFSGVGPVKGPVELVKLDKAACKCDYCLGFGEQAKAAEPEEVGEADQESGTDAAEGKDTYVASTTDGAKAEPAETKPTYLIYFTATWCGPCRQQKPIIEEIKAAGKYKVYIVDIDNDRQAAQAWGVNTVPTFSVVREGKLVWRGQGAGHSRAFIESKLEGK